MKFQALSLATALLASTTLGGLASELTRLATVPVGAEVTGM